MAPLGANPYNNKQAVEAAQLSKAAGKPVNVTWTREEEFFYDYFQPPCLVNIRAGLNANQQICFWDSKAYFTPQLSHGQRGYLQYSQSPHPVLRALV